MSDDFVTEPPEVTHMRRDVALVLIDFYIANNGPKVGHGDYDFRPARDEASKREAANFFIDGLVSTLEEIQTPPEMINDYLERIANDREMSDYVVDAAVERQDRLIEETPELKKEHDFIRSEFRHLMGRTPP